MSPQRPRHLEFYCCQGGSSIGYQRAGFDVYGVDKDPQTRYPCAFHQGDAIQVLAALLAGLAVRFTHRDGTEEWLRLADFASIGASPPCQDYTPLHALHPDKVYPDLIADTRDLLDRTGLPYVIENVMAAPLDKRHSIVLCGGMFGLRTYRHRRFEPSPGLHLTAPAHPKHVTPAPTTNRRAAWDAGAHASITGDTGTYMGPEAMGIDWMTGNGLSEAIPPAYTEHIGRQIMAAL